MRPSLLRDTPAFLLLAALVACGGKATPGTPTDSAPPTESDTDTDADTDADADADADADSDADTDTDADTDADTDTDTDTDGDYTGHTLVLDGDLADWGEWERFDTTDGTSTWIGWDAVNLYVAVQHPDLAYPTPFHWVVVTTGDGGAGSYAGTELGTQQPGLAFPATRQLRWKADDSYSDLQSWSGQWVGVDSWIGTEGSAAFHVGEVVEFQLPRTALGIGDEALVHVNLVYEGAGAESTYAGVPGSSFVAGYDPDFTSWMAFDLAGVVAPADHVASTGTVPTGTDTGTTDTGTPVTTDTGPQPWSATITVDGDPSDFPPDTSFVSSSGHTTRVAWDDTNLYLAVTHPDIATGGAEHWVVAYLGDDEYGSPDGIPLGTQQAVLPFSGDVALRYKADSSYDVLSTFDYGGQMWSDTVGYLAGPGSYAEAGDTVEMALPWSSLPVGAEFRLHTSMVFEGAGFESTYNAMPDTSLVDGSYDPDYASYLAFDRSALDAPAVHGLVLP